MDQNQASLRNTDQYYKQLVLLPYDDIYADYDDEEEDDEEENHEEKVNGGDTMMNLHHSSLFVSDCLESYKNTKYEIKFKYHSFGGNYRQLKSYTDKLPDLASDLYYEIDYNNQVLANRQQVNNNF